MTDKDNGVTKLWNKDFTLVLLLSMLNASASQMVTPLIAKYSISLGASLTLAGTIASLMSIAALVLRPVAGLFSDRGNRKTIIMVTSFLTGVCLFGYSLATSIGAFMVVRLIHGLLFSFSGVALMAFNTSFMPKDRLGEGMGWMALSTVISQAIGPNIGMWLADNKGYGACFTVAGVLCVLTTALILVIPYKKPERMGEKKRIALNDLISMRILPYAILVGLFSCGNGLVNAFLALMGEERGIANCRAVLHRLFDSHGCDPPFHRKAS